MGMYTTGEVAKLCGVSVRTVQYYDTRKLLIPSGLSEGGRRLYSDEDLKKMKIICFLRETGLSINSISELLSEDDPGNVIDAMLEQQEKALNDEIDERKEKLYILDNIRQELKRVEPDNFSISNIGDVAYIMENKKNLTKTRVIMIIIGIIMDIIEITTLVIGFTKGLWWPFAIGFSIVIILAIFVSIFYFKSVAYICPNCHEIFEPRIKDSIFAMHTPRTRRLICPCCNKKEFCVEVYRKS